MTSTRRAAAGAVIAGIVLGAAAIWFVLTVIPFIVFIWSIAGR